MRGVVMYAPGDVRVEDVEEPKIAKPTDAIIRLSSTCICGSDLWPYRGADEIGEPFHMGHEYVGIVEEVGDAVTTVKPSHVRDLSGRLPDLVRQSRGARHHRPRSGAAHASAAGRRHPGRHA
jgi:hypothetical protein